MCASCLTPPSTAIVSGGWQQGYVGVHVRHALDHAKGPTARRSRLMAPSAESRSLGWSRREILTKADEFSHGFVGQYSAVATTPAFRAELVEVAISNLRGFSNARLSIREGLVLLVGPNNSGKTSVLRILDWIINVADEAVLTGGRTLTDHEFALLVPARRTGGTARRITLKIHIPDGRRRRRFHPIGEYVQLRVGVNAEGMVRLNIGEPHRNEQPDDGTALRPSPGASCVHGIWACPSVARRGIRELYGRPSRRRYSKVGGASHPCASCGGTG